MSLKCPNCGGQVAYDPQLKKVVCDFCRWETAEGDFFELEGRQDYDREKEAEDAVPIIMRQRIPQPVPEPSLATDESDDFMEANLYHCKTCGAKLMLTGTEASTFCGFCGSAAIVFERISKEARPKWIIPFRLTREQALSSIKAHFSTGDYIPEKIRELTVEKVHGIYMPYWLFDTYIRRSMIVEATTHDDGTFRYVRDASCHFKRVTLDASVRLNNKMTRRLEPFDTDELTDFDVAYLSGYYADRYDVPQEALRTASVQRCREYLDDAILDSCPKVNRMTIGGMSNYKKKDVREDYRVERVEYALLPAYFVSLKYDTGRDLVMVNGQTGKVVANLPFEKKQIKKKFLRNSLIACPIFMLLTYGILSLNIYPAFFVMAAFTAAMVAGGVSGYKKYKLGRHCMSTSDMTSYTNDRGDKA